MLAICRERCAHFKLNPFGTKAARPPVGIVARTVQPRKACGISRLGGGIGGRQKGEDKPVGTALFSL